MPFDVDVEFSRLRSVLRGLGWTVTVTTVRPDRIEATVEHSIPPEPAPPPTR